MARLKLDHAFIKGTDYRAMAPEDFRQKCDVRMQSDDPMVKAQAAAVLSHLTAYQRIVDEGLDHGFICEDDAIFPDNIHDVLAAMEPALRQDEIVMVCYYSHSKKPLELSSQGARALSGGMQLYAPVDIFDVASTMGYIVPRGLVPSLIASQTPVSFVADGWGKYVQHGAFSKFACLYPPVLEEAPFATMIEYKASKTLKFKIKAIIKKLPFTRGLVAKAMKKRTEQRYQFHIVDAPPFSHSRGAQTASCHLRAG